MNKIKTIAAFVAGLVGPRSVEGCVASFTRTAERLDRVENRLRDKAEYWADREADAYFRRGTAISQANRASVMAGRIRNLLS